MCNSVAPANAMCLRTLNEKHSISLKKYHKKEIMCHTVSIDNCLFCILRKLLQPQQTRKHETLSATYTCLLLKQVLEDFKSSNDEVTCRLFSLPPEIMEPQSGSENNETNGRSFLHLAKLFRKEAIMNTENTLEAMTIDEINKWKDVLCHKLGIEKERKQLHSRYNVVMKIAKSNEMV